MSVNRIENVVKQNLCVSSGVFTLNNAATMEMEKGILVPNFHKKLH